LEVPLDRFESIFKAALELYSQFGLQKVTVQEIADTAGVSKKTIYNHFDGKKDLFYRTFEWHIHKILNYYDSLLSDSEHSLIEKLTLAINYAARQMGYEHSPVYEDIQKYNPYLKNSSIKFLHSNILNAISGLIAQSQKEGLCRKDFSKDKISRSILSMISGLFIWENTTETSLSLADLFKTTITLILDGLLTKEGHLLLSMEKIIL
jgi:AcrR family transcriptional regulator